MASDNTNPWTWDDAHRDYYYVTWDANRQPIYNWAKQQGVTATIAGPSTSHHNRNDSFVGHSSSSLPVATDTTGGAEPSPAPAVSWEVRQSQPNFISGTPERGWYDDLDTSYRMRTGAEAHRFFILGRVFSMLYTEAASETAQQAPDDEAFTVVRFGARAHTQIRRFVVVSVRRNFVHACAISTYRNQGTFKRGCDPSEHALMYNYGVDPESCYFRGEFERGMKDPIAVQAADSTAYLTRESRIRFGKIYSIEWNVKVKDIGVVLQQDLSTLVAHHNAENLRWDQAT